MKEKIYGFIVCRIQRPESLTLQEVWCPLTGDTCKSSSARRRGINPLCQGGRVIIDFILWGPAFNKVTWGERLRLEQ